jgi:hypothetical protein
MNKLNTIPNLQVFMVCSSAQGQSMNISNILITADGGCGDLACSSLRLTSGTPSDTVHINASFASRQKACFQHGGSDGATP